MTKKAQYREFLKSDFWLELSAKKKAGITKCPKCKRKGVTLQCHHTFYRDDWFKTELEDLVVLCRRCHAAEHGILLVDFWRPWIEYTGRSVEECAIFYRCAKLSRMMGRGVRLRERDRRFIEYAMRAFPPTKTDKAVQFHCRSVLESEKFLNENGGFNELVPN